MSLRTLGYLAQVNTKVREEVYRNEKYRRAWKVHEYLSRRAKVIEIDTKTDHRSEAVLRNMGVEKGDVLHIRSLPGDYYGIVTYEKGFIHERLEYKHLVPQYGPEYLDKIPGKYHRSMVLDLTLWDEKYGVIRDQINTNMRLGYPNGPQSQTETLHSTFIYQDIPFLILFYGDVRIFNSMVKEYYLSDGARYGLNEVKTKEYVVLY